MMAGIRALQRSVVVLLAVNFPACVLAAAGAGAGGAIHFSGNTAEAIVDRPVETVAGRAEAVMRGEQIEVTASSVAESGAKREYKGGKGDLDVNVTIEREKDSGKTKVRVNARRNLVSWDKAYAKELLAKMIE